ncbi:hypothetical protein PG996_014183 [Apiospora saccharicola]|uniref:Uncharacterized protein n=1 Tax=Apiospora saccharicola TaxID=335842 RepID=A0ABR1THL8_9PEZI
MCLVSSKPLDSWGREPLELPVQLLRVSKAVHDEACLVLYAHNTFDLHWPYHKRKDHGCLETGLMPMGPDRRETDRKAKQPVGLDRFLKSIGHNAKYIRHVIIRYPVVTDRCCHLSIDENATDGPKIIQRRCPNLVTLSTRFDCDRFVYRACPLATQNILLRGWPESISFSSVSGPCSNSPCSCSRLIPMLRR